MNHQINENVINGAMSIVRLRTAMRVKYMLADIYDEETSIKRRLETFRDLRKIPPTLFGAEDRASIRLAGNVFFEEYGMSSYAT